MSDAQDEQEFLFDFPVYSIGLTDAAGRQAPVFDPDQPCGFVVPGGKLFLFYSDVELANAATEDLKSLHGVERAFVVRIDQPAHLGEALRSLLSQGARRVGVDHKIGTKPGGRSIDILHAIEMCDESARIGNAGKLYKIKLPVYILIRRDDSKPIWGMSDGVCALPLFDDAEAARSYVLRVGDTNCLCAMLATPQIIIRTLLDITGGKDLDIPVVLNPIDTQMVQEESRLTVQRVIDGFSDKSQWQYHS